MSIPTPKFPYRFNDSDLETNLKQSLKIPSIIKGIECTIHVDYEHTIKDKEDKERLFILVPEFPTPDERQGIDGEFYHNKTSGFKSKFIKNKYDHFESPCATSAFDKCIQPILDKKIPDYMLQLTKQK